jgi:hypothetical protein
VSDAPDILVYAYRYSAEPASRKEYDGFSSWLRRAGIEGVSAYRGKSTEEGTEFWFIVVVDFLGGRTLEEFAWTGEVQDLSADQAEAFVRRAHPGVSRTSYGETRAPRMRPDGTWDIPKPGQG